MEDTSQEIQDPSKEGIGGIKGLSGVSSKKPKVVPHQYNQSKIDALKEKGYDTTLLEKHNRGFAQSMEQDIENSSPTVAIGNADYGKSSFDMQASLPSQLENLNDTRGELQPAWMQIGSGVAKAAVNAGTTFADGMAGTVLGLLNIGIQADNIANSPTPWAATLNAFINNPLSSNLQKLNEAAEDWFPNYYTDEENETPWYTRLLSANVLGNDFIKNIGFMVGGALSGKLSGSLISKAMKMQEIRDVFKGAVNAAGVKVETGKDLVKAIKAAKAGNIVNSGDIKEALKQQAKELTNKSTLLKWEGSLIAATGEARIEAITDTKPWMDNFMQRAGDERDQALESIEDNIYAQHPDYFSTVMDREAGTMSHILTDPRGLALKKQYTDKINDRYNQIAQAVAQKGMFMSNQIFGLNTLFLTIDNALQMGRLITGGYSTGRNFKSLVKEDLKTAMSAPTEAIQKNASKAAAKEFESNVKSGVKQALKDAKKEGRKLSKDEAEKSVRESLGGAAATPVSSMGGFTANQSEARGVLARAIANPFIEGNEEMAQAAIQETTGHKHSSELNDYFHAQIDPSALKKTESWAQSTWEGLKNTYGNSDQWEQGVIGFITGMMGMPMVTIRTNEEGKKRPHVSFGGEFVEGLKDYSAIRRETQEVVDEMNNRIHDPKFLNYWYGITAHNYFQEQKDNSIDIGDPKSFKDADFKQFVSDVLLFDKAGKLGDLENLINTGLGVKPEDIETIKQMSVDSNTGHSFFDGFNSDDDILSHVQKQAKEAKKRFNTIVGISNDLKTLYGDKLDRGVIDELIMGMSTMDDQASRMKEILDDKDTRETIATLVDKMSKEDIKKSMDILNKNISDKSSQFNSDEKGTASLKQEILSALRKGDAEELNNSYNRTDVIQVLNDVISKVKNEDPKSSNSLITDKFVQQLTDFRQLYTDRAALIDTVRELSQHPEKFSETAMKVYVEKQREAEQVYKDTMRKDVEDNITTIDDVNKYFSNKNITSPKFRRQIIDIMKESSKPGLSDVAKGYESRDRVAYLTATELMKAISEDKISNDPSVLEAVKQVLLTNMAHESNKNKSGTELIAEMRKQVSPESPMDPKIKETINDIIDAIEEKLNNLNGIEKVKESKAPKTNAKPSASSSKTKSNAKIDVFNIGTEQSESQEHPEDDEVDKITHAPENEKERILNEAVIAKSSAGVTEEDKKKAEETIQAIKGTLLHPEVTESDNLNQNDSSLNELSDLEKEKHYQESETIGNDKIVTDKAKSTDHFRSGYTQYDTIELKNGNLTLYTINQTIPIYTSKLRDYGAYDFLDHGNLARLINYFESKNNPLKVHFILDPTTGDHVMSKEVEEAYKKARNIPADIPLTPTIWSAISYDDIQQAIKDKKIKESEISLDKLIELNGHKYQIIGMVSAFPQAETGNDGKIVLKQIGSIDELFKLKRLISDELNKTSTISHSEKYYTYITKDYLYSGRIVRGNGTLRPITTDDFKNGSYTDSPLFMLYRNRQSSSVYSRDIRDNIVVGLNYNNPMERNGTFWLYTLEADGKWYPKALSVRRYGENPNSTEHDTDYDELNGKTAISRKLKAAMEMFVNENSTNNQKLDAKRTICSILNMDSRMLYFSEHETRFHNATLAGTKEEKIQQLNEYFSKSKLRFNVDISKLSAAADKEYFDSILEAGILVTDLRQMHNVNAGFDLPIPKIDSEGNVDDSAMLGSSYKKYNGNKEIQGFNDIVYNKVTYRFDYSDPNHTKIYEAGDSSKKPIEDADIINFVYDVTHILDSTRGGRFLFGNKAGFDLGYNEHIGNGIYYKVENGIFTKLKSKDEIVKYINSIKSKADDDAKRNNIEELIKSINNSGIYDNSEVTASIKRPSDLSPFKSPEESKPEPVIPPVTPVASQPSPQTPAPSITVMDDSDFGDTGDESVLPQTGEQPPAMSTQGDYFVIVDKVNLNVYLEAIYDVLKVNSLITSMYNTPADAVLDWLKKSLNTSSPITKDDLLRQYPANDPNSLGRQIQDRIDNLFKCKD